MSFQLVIDAPAVQPLSVFPFPLKKVQRVQQLAAAQAPSLSLLRAFHRQHNKCRGCVFFCKSEAFNRNYVTVALQLLLLQLLYIVIFCDRQIVVFRLAFIRCCLHHLQKELASKKGKRAKCWRKSLWLLKSALRKWPTFKWQLVT